MLNSNKSQILIVVISLLLVFIGIGESLGYYIVTFNVNTGYNLSQISNGIEYSHSSSSFTVIPVIPIQFKFIPEIYVGGLFDKFWSIALKKFQVLNFCYYFTFLIGIFQFWKSNYQVKRLLEFGYILLFLSSILSVIMIFIEVSFFYDFESFRFISLIIDISLILTSFWVIKSFKEIASEKLTNKEKLARKDCILYFLLDLLIIASLTFGILGTTIITLFENQFGGLASFFLMFFLSRLINFSIVETFFSTNIGLTLTNNDVITHSQTNEGLEYRLLRGTVTLNPFSKISKKKIGVGTNSSNEPLDNTIKWTNKGLKIILISIIFIFTRFWVDSVKNEITSKRNSITKANNLLALSNTTLSNISAKDTITKNIFYFTFGINEFGMNRSQTFILEGIKNDSIEFSLYEEKKEFRLDNESFVGNTDNLKKVTLSKDSLNRIIISPNKEGRYRNYELKTNGFPDTKYVLLDTIIEVKRQGYEKVKSNSDSIEDLFLE